MPLSTFDPQACKHPRVRVVSRTDDEEFVECELCGEVFDSEEFADMQIEEQATEDDEEDSSLRKRASTIRFRTVASTCAMAVCTRLLRSTPFSPNQLSVFAVRAVAEVRSSPPCILYLDPIHN